MAGAGGRRRSCWDGRAGWIRAGEPGTVFAWLHSGDGLRGALSDAGLLRGKSRRIRGSCRAVGARVSWAALRPEDAGAERLPVLGHGVVQRGDFPLCHGADLRGAACLRSHCDRMAPSANWNASARDGRPSAAGAGLCSAGRAWSGHVQPGAAVLCGDGRYAAHRTAWFEEDWRMERAEGCGSGGFSA